MRTRGTDNSGCSRGWKLDRGGSRAVPTVALAVGASNRAPDSAPAKPRGPFPIDAGLLCARHGVSAGRGAWKSGTGKTKEERGQGQGEGKVDENANMGGVVGTHNAVALPGYPGLPIPGWWYFPLRMPEL